MARRLVGMRTKRLAPVAGGSPATIEGERRERLIALYQAERVAMVRLAHLLTGSVAVAEDVVQDAFVRLHPVMDRVEQPGPYLRRTVVNLCQSHHRRRRVEDRYVSKQRSPESSAPPELDEVWRALDQLAPRARAVLVLRFYLDLRVNDISELLDVPAGTVKSDLHRSLAALSKEVER